MLSRYGPQGPGRSYLQEDENCVGLEVKYRDFPGDIVVKNPPDKAGDTGLSPGPGRPHMPQSN